MTGRRRSYGSGSTQHQSQEHNSPQASRKSWSGDYRRTDSDDEEWWARNNDWWPPEKRTYDSGWFKFDDTLGAIVGSWKCQTGSIYHVSPDADDAPSCTVRTTREDGRERITKALIKCSENHGRNASGRVLWGQGYELEPFKGRPDSIRWLPRGTSNNRAYMWKRIEDSESDHQPQARRPRVSWVSDGASQDPGADEWENGSQADSWRPRASWTNQAVVADEHDPYRPRTDARRPRMSWPRDDRSIKDEPCDENNAAGNARHPRSPQGAEDYRTPGGRTSVPRQDTRPSRGSMRAWADEDEADIVRPQRSEIPRNQAVCNGKKADEVRSQRSEIPRNQVEDTRSHRSVVPRDEDVKASRCQYVDFRIKDAADRAAKEEKEKQEEDDGWFERPQAASRETDWWSSPGRTSTVHVGSEENGWFEKQPGGVRTSERRKSNASAQSESLGFTPEEVATFALRREKLEVEEANLRVREATVTIQEARAAQMALEAAREERAALAKEVAALTEKRIAEQEVVENFLYEQEFMREKLIKCREVVAVTVDRMDMMMEGDDEIREEMITAVEEAKAAAAEAEDMIEVLSIAADEVNADPRNSRGKERDTTREKCRDNPRHAGRDNGRDTGRDANRNSGRDAPRDTRRDLRPENGRDRGGGHGEGWSKQNNVREGRSQRHWQ